MEGARVVSTLMGILTALRRTLSSAVASATGPRPLELACISGETAADVVYQGFRGGLRILVMRDYPEAPWAWSVEDASDGRLVAFRGSCPSYDAAALAVSEWLASDEGEACQGGKREGFDVPPAAA